MDGRSSGKGNPGATRRVRKRSLRNGLSTSCGCGRRTTTPLEVGERFGRLLIEQKAGKNARGRDQVIVLCDCGRRKVVPEIALRQGATKSCGCFRSDQVAKASRTHGESRAPLYRRWAAMFTRTRTAPYIGRGITVTPEWNDFLVFKDYVEKNLGPRPQRRESAHNRLLTAQGQTRSLVEWSEISGVSVQAIRARLKLGWSEERAVLEPARKHVRDRDLNEP